MPASPGAAVYAMRGASRAPASGGGVTLILGDCLEVMAGLEPDSIDAICTDPPYGINFMGKAWDGAAIEASAEKERARKRAQIAEGRMPPEVRLTGSPESLVRKLIPRTGSAFMTAAGEAGSYDFSARGNRAFQEWCSLWGTECHRILKPGGHLLSFGGTRTYHRLASGLEDAGFEIRDCIAWMFGSGFPKSLDVSKAIDKAEGHWRGKAGEPLEDDALRSFGQHYERNDKGDPVTAAAAAAAGWGTALKPAFEPIVVARKPFSGSVAANVRKWGTGALNIDDSRIGVDGGTRQTIRKPIPSDGAVTTFGRTLGSAQNGNEDAGGRWPANVILDEDAGDVLDEQSGKSASVSASMSLPLTPGDSLGGGHGTAGRSSVRGHDDTGGASRFFYCAKVSRAERNAGLDGFEKRQTMGELPDAEWATGANAYLVGGARRAANNHPTVKPVDLMRWVVRLVTPPGGLVLDPFLGSGTTGIAAHLEGFRFLGIEREADYLAIATARLAFWQEHGEDGLRICREADAADRIHTARIEAGQLLLI